VLTALACVVVSLVTACAIVPDDGRRVTSARIARNGNEQSALVQLIPPEPQRGWSPGLIVSGFLLASGSFAGNHAIAREYLTPSAARSWRPGSAVAEFADTPTATTSTVRQNSVTFQVNGRFLGTISEDGQYQAAEQGASRRGWGFTVVRVRGQWRIANPPEELLLSRRDVDRTFRSRDLYFFDPSMSVLVPDPVHVPAEVTSADLVTHLVQALRQGPQGWLEVGTRTAFPPGTRVLGTSVDGSTAIVNLGGRAAVAGSQQRDQMATQLLQTLASSSAFPAPDVPSIQSVVFEINGRPVHVSCATGRPPTLQLTPACSGPVPPSPGSRVYYIDSRGRVATLFGARLDSPAPGPAGSGRQLFDEIAVSPDQMSVAGASGGVLYTGSLTLTGSLVRRLTATSLTTLSWDSAGWLWAAGRRGGRARVWRLGPSSNPVEVRLPYGFGPVTAMRVAPDGVRVAMITGSGPRSRLWLAAIDRGGKQLAIGPQVPIGTDISGFSDLTWYDTGDVIVLTRPSSGAVLYEVPVDGGQSRPIATDAGTVSITASSGGKLVALRDDGTLIQLPNPSGSIWKPPGARGRSPVYPG